MLRNVSTHNRLVVVIILAVLPMLGLTVYGAFQQRAYAEADAAEHLRLLVKLAARHHQQVVEGARDTLTAVAQLAAALPRDRAVCNTHFAEMLQRSGNKYHNMGVISPSGETACAGYTSGVGSSVRDRLYVRLARETGQFSIGEYQIGRATRRAGINFGFPVMKNGALEGIAFLALDLGELQQSAAKLPLPPQGVLILVDGNGTIVSRQPSDEGRVGIKVRSKAVHESLMAAGSGLFEGPGSDGVTRLFATEPVVNNPDGSVALKVSISVPKHLVFEHADKELARDLAGILIATVLLIVVGRYTAERYVLRDIRVLLRTAQCVRAGDLTARTGMRAGNAELRQIGGALDDMADALQERDRQLQHAMGKLVTQATSDALTGLCNRRHLQQHLPLELARAKRHGEPFALIMVDADHFKRLNDTFGHDAGDVALKEIANTLKGNIRASDLTWRYGGEEFVVVLNNAGLPGARERAELIRAAIARLDLRHDGRSIGSVTVSIGVAVFPHHGGDTETLVRAADVALYEAKAAGRNRVMVCGEADAPTDSAATKARRSEVAALLTPHDDSPR
jgi:diguanylate cyclase (GGDEF)-like protein